MKTIMTTYRRFWRLMSGQEDARKEFNSFYAVCRYLKVPPADLEEVLMDELGLCGEEIMSIYGV